MRWWPFERKSLASPTDEELYVLTGGGAGVASLTQALTVPAVQSAVHLIAGSIAAFPLLIERREGDQWTPDDKHEVAELLADQPNGWSSTYELIRDVIATALCHDKGGLALVNRVRGEVREVIRYEPNAYTVEWSTDGRQEPAFKIGNAPVSIDDLIYLRSPFSRCPVSLAGEAIAVAKAMETHAGNLFTRGARPGGVIQTPKNVGDEGVKRMLAGWRAAHEGPDKSGKTAVLWDGAIWNRMTLSSVDAQFLELWKFVVLEVARAFRVPPSMLFDYDRATWSNAEQAAKEWLASLELWMRPLEASMRRALFGEDERRDWRIRFDRDDFSAVDLTARATAINGLIASRTLSPNEGRDWLGLPPREGGDEYANPNTGGNQPPAIREVPRAA
jgi:HK97 family phage portal protein